MPEKKTPAYYAIITADVRYDKELKANEKLLYGEITALANKNGFCWAENGYFAELYDVTTRTVSDWISNLVDKGYLKREIIKDNKNRVKGRKLFINVGTTPDEENFHTPMEENLHTPMEENFVTMNNTSKTSNITSNEYKDSCYLNGNDWPRPSELPRNNQNHRIYPKEFEDLYNVYPDRPNEDKGRAYKKVRARINEGINYVDLGKAAMNYSKYCDIEDKTGTKYVKMMSTFFGESDPWVEFQDYDFEKVDKEDPEGFDQLKEIWGELEEEEEFIDG